MTYSCYCIIQNIHVGTDKLLTSIFTVVEVYTTSNKIKN